MGDPVGSLTNSAELWLYFTLVYLLWLCTSRNLDYNIIEPIIFNKYLGRNNASTVNSIRYFTLVLVIFSSMNFSTIIGVNTR